MDALNSITLRKCPGPLLRVYTELGLLLSETVRRAHYTDVVFLQ